jgi:hypothetical protein
MSLAAAAYRKRTQIPSTMCCLKVTCIGLLSETLRHTGRKLMCNAALCIAKQDDFAPAIFLVFSLLEESALL